MSATDGAATLDHTLRVLRKAEVSFLLMIQVRKKIFDTYREVLCMEVE